MLPSTASRRQFSNDQILPATPFHEDRHALLVLAFSSSYLLDDARNRSERPHARPARSDATDGGSPADLVVLGGLAELSRQNRRHKLLREVQRIADAAMRVLVDGSGILHDPCEPKCGADGTQFKGIFVRNLALLDQRDHRSRNARFIMQNAQGLLANDQGPDHSSGVVWSGPPGDADASTQSSAIDALVAALQLGSGGNRK